jgi:transposase
VTGTAPHTDVLLGLIAELREQNAQLQEQNARLQEQNARLQEQNARLQEQNAQLQAEVTGLQAQVTGLHEQVAELREENAALLHRAETAEAENAELREQVRVLTERLDVVERENAELKKRVTGRTTERTGQRRKDNPRPKNDAEAQRKRREAREKRKSALASEDVSHPVDPEAKACCPKCGGGPMSALSPECSDEFEWVPGHLVRLRHVRERVVCACGHFETGPAPVRVVDGGLYGPGFHARVVVHKLLDCVPLYRQVQAFRREGLHVARATLVDIFHRVASLIEPIYERMLDQVPASRVVYADETSLKMQRVDKLAYIWTFATAMFITYVFSPSRSGSTAERVLGASTGVLVVDGYTGYNSVTVPEKRARAGCNAHARRKFRKVDDDDAAHIVELYKEVWAVEREAKQGGFFRTPEHLALRRARAGPAMTAIKAWCDEHHGEHTPKSAMGEAIRYIRNQYVFLTRFLTDVEIDPDNNLSERLLRIIALGRKNYLFVGHEQAGRNSAMLASLLATCVMHGVNPQDYLADVLIRVQTHPAARLDDLLPHRWKVLYGPDAQGETEQAAA